MNSTAIRGSVLTFKGNPFLNPVEECLQFEEDAIILMKNGLIVEFGPAAVIQSKLPDGTSIQHYTDSLILPGFIDCHVHYPQTEIIGAY